MFHGLVHRVQLSALGVLIPAKKCLTMHQQFLSQPIDVSQSGRLIHAVPHCSAVPIHANLKAGRYLMNAALQSSAIQRSPRVSDAIMALGGGGGGDIVARAYVMLRRQKCTRAMSLIRR